MLRWSRLSTVLVSLLVAGPLFWGGQLVAQADELSDAKAKLTVLQGESAAAGEKYSQVKASLDVELDKLKQAEEAIAAQQEKVDALRQQVAIVSLQQFQDRGVTSTAFLFTSASRDEALNFYMVSAMVSDTTVALLQSYQLSQAGLADLQRDHQSIVDTVKAEKARLEKLKNEAKKKVREAEALVRQLTIEQQAAIAAANAAAMAGDLSGGKPTNYSPPPPVQNGAAAQKIVNYVMSKVGLPYSWGGAGPNSYDCSGLTMAAYAKVGIRLPHGSASQFRYGNPVARADLQPGDLVFYYSGPGHVGIYVGGGMIVDARNSGVGVVYRPVTGEMPFVGARRLL